MKPRTRRFADVALIELLRPDPYWPDPYSTEMAFQALRWLIASASSEQFVEEHRWHTSCAIGLMGGAGARNGACRAIRSRTDLRERFIQALLARPAWRPEVARWRAAKGIHIDAVVRMKFRHYKPYYPPAHLPWRSEADIKESLDSLLEKSTGVRPRGGAESSPRRCAHRPRHRHHRRRETLRVHTALWFCRPPCGPL